MKQAAQMLLTLVQLVDGLIQSFPQCPVVSIIIRSQIFGICFNFTSLEGPGVLKEKVEWY